MEELRDHLLRDDLAKLHEAFASLLCNEAELGKVSSERIDYGVDSLTRSQSRIDASWMKAR
jgi:hypothetical protein